MASYSPIILIEDDSQYAEIVISAIRDVGVPNPVRLFDRAAEAHDYLLVTDDQPLVILCDIKMSNLDGLSFRRQVFDNPYLNQKAIPFVFLSGMVSEAVVREAYALNVQGFFDKPATYQELKDHLLAILVYWRRARHPNTPV